MRIIPIVMLAVIGTGCGASFPLSGAWEGSCELNTASPVSGSTTYDYRLVIEENFWGGGSTTTTGWDFYAGTYSVTSGERSWDGQGFQFSHCNLSAGCGDINDPFYPTTADTYVEWGTVTNDEIAGYPNVDFRFWGAVSGGTMTGNCQQVFEQWSGDNAPAFDIGGTASAEHVSKTEEPY